MPHALPRWWFLLLVALVTLATLAIGDTLGLGPFHGPQVEPSAMPVACPPNC